MHDLWSSASYEAHLLSLPFALAPAAMLIVIAYTAVMRGSTSIRGWLLAHCLALLPYATVMMLAPSIRSEAVAAKLFQISAGFIPMAAAAGTAFQLAMVRKHRTHRRLIWLGIASSMIWVVVGVTSAASVSGVQPMSGFWYAVAGPWAWLALLHTVVLSIGGFVALTHAALRGKPSIERRQQRLILVANFVTYAGLIDVGLAYGIGVFPLGWLLSGVGCLLVVRALVVEDLLRVRAVDTGAPLLVAHFAAAILLGWVVLALLGPDRPWWLTMIALLLVFSAVRASVATVGLINRGGRVGEGPLERLLEQLVTRARTMTDARLIAQLAIDIVQLAIGVRAHVLLATQTDWGWTTESGLRLDDEQAPDPFLVGWLAEQRGALFATDLEAVPPDLRELVANLLERHQAMALVPIGSVDELIALVMVPASARRVRGSPLAFLKQIAKRLAEALLHARLALRAAERANLAREVRLAATVQGELLPGKGPHVHGDITVIGSWQPATRCAGDFWCVYPLGEGRVLVAIGDVTGHGVASAMVTAAAIGACDVFVRRSGPTLQLTELTAALDTAVRSVGGGQLAMTCFAAIMDPAAHEIRFVSCGHTAPYLCRPAGKVVELHALVGRGNPLGSGVPTVPRVLQRPLQAEDLVVWYTDGVIEAQDPGGTPFGDRRLQHLLKRLDRSRLTPAQVHALVQSGLAAHRAGHPLADDETLVVAQLAREASP
ncbi:hypothetical protein BH11MYX3_BH11MYX3_03240 [soil metagenome]